MSQPRRYRMVAFDFDGTLADTFPWFESVLGEVAERHRLPQVRADEVEGLRMLGSRAILSRLGIPAWKLPLIGRHMRALFRRDRAGIALFPGVAELLRDLDRQAVPLAVVSSNGEDNIRAVLGPEADRVRVYACGASLFGKARALGRVTRSQRLAGPELLYVGDEIRDAEAAAAAGCDFAAVGWGYTRAAALRTTNPAFLFSNPAEVAPALAGSGVAR